MVNWDESPPEAEVESYYVKQVKKRGGTAYKFKSANNRSVPDRITTLYGFTHYVETKREGKEATEAQKKKHKTLRDAGGVVFVLAGHGQVDEYLELMDKCKEKFKAFCYAQLVELAKEEKTRYLFCYKEKVK